MRSPCMFDLCSVDEREKTAKAEEKAWSIKECVHCCRQYRVANVIVCLSQKSTPKGSLLVDTCFAEQSRHGNLLYTLYWSVCTPHCLASIYQKQQRNLAIPV